MPVQSGNSDPRTTYRGAGHGRQAQEQLTGGSKAQSAKRTAQGGCGSHQRTRTAQRYAPGESGGGNPVTRRCGVGHRDPPCEEQGSAEDGHLVDRSIDRLGRAGRSRGDRTPQSASRVAPDAADSICRPAPLPSGEAERTRDLTESCTVRMLRPCRGGVVCPCRHETLSPSPRRVPS